MPWLPSAKKNKGYHDRLYAAWDNICDAIRERGPYDDMDPSFLAMIGRQRESDTGMPTWFFHSQEHACSVEGPVLENCVTIS